MALADNNPLLKKSFLRLLLLSLLKRLVFVPFDESVCTSASALWPLFLTIKNKKGKKIKDVIKATWEARSKDRGVLYGPLTIFLHFRGGIY